LHQHRGEKVYPEEVEEVLKTHVAVADAAVVGVPDLNYGEQIVAAVECYDEAPDAAELIDHVKATWPLQGATPRASGRLRRPIPFGQARLRPAPQRGPGLAGERRDVLRRVRPPSSPSCRLCP